MSSFRYYSMTILLSRSLCCSTSTLKYLLRKESALLLIVPKANLSALSRTEQHGLAAVSPKLIVNQFRFVRSRSDNKEGFTHEKEQFSEKESSSEDGNKNESKEPNSEPKVDPAMLKKLRIYVLIVASLSFVSSFLILAQFTTGQSELDGGEVNEHLNSQTIDMDTFVNRYLKAGEVKKIIFAPSYNKAIVVLHEGAIIDGKKHQDTVVVVAYDNSAQQFWADVRKTEADLGIPLTQGVNIQMYQPMTTFRIVEFLLGITIVVFLGTQYGRLLLKKYMASKTKQKG